MEQVDKQHLSELSPEDLESGGDYVGVALRDGRLTQPGLDGITLEGSLLCKVSSPAIALCSFRLREVTLRDCDFANSVWENAYFSNANLSKCRLTGWNVAEALFRNVQFTGCRIDLAIFHNAALIDCHFQSCDLREADFQAARLKNVVFRRCDLRSARFPTASLDAIDFRGSHLAGVYLEAGSLRGSIFDPSQLPEVAQVFGLIVRELDEEELGLYHWKP